MSRIERVGFVGLGSQGAPMAHMIERAGFDLSLWARRAESLEPFADTGAKVAPTLRALGETCQLVGVCVVSDADVEEVVLGDNLLAGMAPGGIIAIHSTVHPDTCTKLAGEAEPRGVTILDAPVSGSGEAAYANTLAVMVGGDADAFELARPVFESYGSPVRLMGALGTGQLCKLVNNILLIANIKLADQALEFGDALGIQRQPLVEMLQASSGRSFAMDAWTRMMGPDTAGHIVNIFEKDVRLAEDAAAQHGADIETLKSVARQTIERVARLGNEEHEA